MYNFLFRSSSFCTFALLLLSAASMSHAQQENVDAKLWCQYEGNDGPGAGKHIVLIAGDDEYRSEEALPMLGKILAVRHGFKCSVLFPVNDNGIVQPDFQKNIPGMHLLDSADLIILGLRFRNLPDKQMEHFDRYLQSGKPIIGLRTSTHAFRIPKESKFAHYSFNSKVENWVGGFGQTVLGDTWINHHGDHGRESTRGIINSKYSQHPILRGVDDVWGSTDVYGIIHLPAVAKTLLRGQVIDGMKPSDEPVEGKKNKPMMPIAWTSEYTSQGGKTNKVFCTTMGAATDFQSEDLRRVVVNASLWLVGLESSIKPDLNVSFVDPYQPTKFGFGNFKKDRRPAFYDLKKK